MRSSCDDDWKFFSTQFLSCFQPEELTFNYISLLTWLNENRSSVDRKPEATQADARKSFSVNWMILDYILTVNSDGIHRNSFNFTRALIFYKFSSYFLLLSNWILIIDTNVRENVNFFSWIRFQYDLIEHDCFDWLDSWLVVIVCAGVTRSLRSELLCMAEIFPTFQHWHAYQHLVEMASYLLLRDTNSTSSWLSSSSLLVDNWSSISLPDLLVPLLQLFVEFLKIQHQFASK